MCDCLVALWPATASRATLFAKNSDRPPDETQLVQRIEPHWEPTTTATYIEIDGHSDETIPFVGSRPGWMWGVEHGVNAASVAAGNATIYTTLDPRDAPRALTGMDIVRLVLERATSARDGVELIGMLLDKYGQGGSGHTGVHRPYWNSFLVADPSSAFVVETSGRVYAVEQVDRFGQPRTAPPSPSSTRSIGTRISRWIGGSTAVSGPAKPCSPTNRSRSTAS